MEISATDARARYVHEQDEHDAVWEIEMGKAAATVVEPAAAPARSPKAAKRKSKARLRRGSILALGGSRDSSFAFPGDANAADEDHAVRMNRAYEFLTLTNVNARIVMDRCRKRARDGSRYSHYCQLHHGMQTSKDVTDMYKRHRTSELDLQLSIKTSGKDYFTSNGPAVDNALILCWTVFPLLARFYRSIDGRPKYGGSRSRFSAADRRGGLPRAPL